MKVNPSTKVKLTKVNFKTIATTRSFEYLVDTAREKGGSNIGPTPVEYFLGAIASCVAITLRTFANKMDWDLGEISVEMQEQTKLTQKGIVKTLIEHITIEKNCTAEQFVKLKEIAKTCPVAQMVSGETKIISNLNN